MGILYTAGAKCTMEEYQVKLKAIATDQLSPRCWKNFTCITVRIKWVSEDLTSKKLNLPNQDLYVHFAMKQVSGMLCKYFILKSTG